MQDALLAPDAYVMDGHGCENSLAVNLSVLCSCVCVCVSSQVNITCGCCVRKWKEESVTLRYAFKNDYYKQIDFFSSIE